MTPGYVVRRVLLFVLVVWMATSVIFFLPRLAPGRDPIRERLMMMSVSGSVMQSAIEEMARAYEARFGLDQPLYVQYFRFLGDIVQLDFNVSLMMYPSRVIDLIGQALPWTVGLLLTATVLAFSLGTLLGGLSTWPRAPRALSYLLPPLFAFSAVPYYLLGILLVYLFALKLPIFPISGGAPTGTLPSFTIGYMLTVAYHSALPALSMVLAATGFWALGMRGMMVTTQGEDFMIMAEAKGLKGWRVFLHYGMRTAILPQITALALSLGHIVSGALLVEIIFQYPGVGTLLYKAITGFDFFTINGIVFFVIVGVGIATLLLDLSYHALDPRIKHART
ncbi:MAG TPA: ABC transporter permease [Chloroflexota bacterium]|nr:ABC transporter permease [Chloroflexota bacterium]